MRTSLLFLTLIFAGAAQAAPGDPNPKLKVFEKKISPEWLFAEQHLSNSTPFMSNIRNPIGLFVNDAKHHGTLEEKYQPHLRNVFAPGSALIPYEDAVVVGAKVPETLVHTDASGKKFIRYFFHPSQKPYYWKLSGATFQNDYQATPSSSARSLFVIHPERHELFIAKTSLNNSIMGGFDRQISLDEAMRSVYNSNRLKELHQRVDGKLPDSGLKWDFFHESAAIFPSDPTQGGFIFRELPESLNNKNITLLPMYSLVAKNPDHRPMWIEKLFADSGYKNKADFIHDQFAKPMTELFSQLGFDAGITAQMHQQNLMVSVEKMPNGKHKVTGLFIRDTEALFPVLSLQEKAGRIPPAPDALLEATTASRAMRNLYSAEDQIFMYKISASKFLQGYAEDMRYNSVRSIFKYFLDRTELDKMTVRMDQYFVEKMNQALPKEFASGHISEVRKNFFAFDEQRLRALGRTDILAERRIQNPSTDFFVRNYEAWINSHLTYDFRPSEAGTLCGFILKKLPSAALGR